MSAAAQLPAPTTDPDPPRAGADMPAALGRVLAVVRRLIDIGKQLAGSVQQRSTAPGFVWFARLYGTRDVAAILARITGGLRRAAALEAALVKRAASGRDLTMAPLRMPAARGQRTARPVAPPEPQPDPRLARLPTEAEIAAEVRRRPVGAVIADICHDLGIRPGQLDRAFWDELSLSIIRYGGSLMGFLPKQSQPMLDIGPDDLPDGPDLGWPVGLPRFPAPATGPPP